MRCLALADAARRGGAQVVFVTRPLPPHLLSMLSERGYAAVTLHRSDDAADARQTSAALAHAEWHWLVVDHYALGEAWESIVRRTVPRILAIDDLADRVHDCDVLLDQNVWTDTATRYDGKVPAQCTQLIGPSYALLREEFACARQTATPRSGPVRRVLVSFGGMDAGNWTSRAIDALAPLQHRFDSVDVVIGAGHRHEAAITAACGTFGFTCHVQPTALAALMARADLAVGAGGVSTWERCCVGLPAMTVAVAPNQHAVVAESARQGLVYAIPESAQTPAALTQHIASVADNQPLRERLSRAGMDAVDGQGTARVLAALDLDAIRMRQATSADEAALLEWRNDETVRRSSRRADRIDADAHHAWLASLLADADRFLLIGERHGESAGVVRFDIAGSQAQVSIYRVPGVTGTGLGGRLLAAAEEWLRARRPDVTTLTADVLESNERSHRLFRSAGYQWRTARYEKQVRRA